MAIENRDLYRSYQQFEASTTLQQALEKAGENDDTYLVVVYADGKYAVVRLGDLRQSLEGFNRQNDRLTMLNGHLGDLLTGFITEAVDQQTTELWQAEQTRRRMPSQCVVVLSQGKVVGLLAPRMAAEATVFRGAAATEFGVLGGEEAAEVTEPTKKINVELVDQDLNRVKPDENPLQLSKVYTLVLDVSDEGKPTSLVADALLKYLWKEGEQEVTLTVRLESDDFEVLTEPQKIKIPRTGDSNKGRFDLKPKREGRGVVNVLFFKDDLFIQLLTLKFTIVDGALFDQETAGRTLSAAFAAQPRSLSLTILEADGGFQLIMTGAVAALAKLPITRESLAQRIKDMREALRKDVVFMKVPGAPGFVYQDKIDIPAEARDAALRRLADVGYSMYREIFYGLDADAQANLLGDRLREIARKEDRLQIQIFSQHFMMPWGILYMASDEEYDPQDVHADWFLGFKHIIEHIPLQQVMQVLDSTIDSRAGLVVSVNVNQDIDAQMGAPLVADQLSYWKGVEGKGEAKLVQRVTASELMEALRTTQNTPDQIIYFYCHAISKDLEEGGPDTSTLVLSKNEKLTLKDLKLQATHKRLLPGQPLVFINACESAELSPLFYDGFVPYFLAKGARGVIGTECETPAVFAVEWAKLFFDRFLKGESVGAIALELRKEFLKDHNNPLGLLYALYVDGDTQIAPGLEG